VALTVDVVGSFRLSWQGEPVQVTSRKGRALLAFLSVRQGPVPRTTLAELLWGPRGGRNLRQLLYTLRRLPGAADWLDDGELVSVRAEVRLEGEGTALEDLDTDGFPEAFAEWLEVFRTETARTLARSAGESQRGPMAELLGAMREPSVPSLSRALGLSEQVVAAMIGLVVPAEGPAPAHAHHRLALAHVDPREQAYHWLQAGEPDRAARALAELEAWGEAARIAVDIELRCRLLGAAVDAAEQANDRSGIDGLLADLTAWSQVEADPRVALLAALRRSREHWRRGRAPVALDLAQEALRIAQRHDLDRGPVSLILGQLQLSEGRNQGAHGSFDEATRSTDADTACLGFTGRGAASALLGNLEAALDDHREALARARQQGSAVRVTRGLCNVASDLNRLGRFAEAARRYEEAVQAAERLGDETMEAVALSNGSLNALWAGQFARCRELVARAHDRAVATQNPRARGQALDSRGELEAWCGRRPEAIGWAERAAALHASMGDEVRCGLSRANAAVYAAAVDPGRADHAWGLVQGFMAFERPAPTAQLALDLALFTPPRPHRLVQIPLRDGVGWLHGQRALVQARWARMSDRPPVVDELLPLASTPGHLQALAARFLRTVGADGPDPDRVREERCMGLLSAQAEAMEEMIKAWNGTLMLR